MAGLTSWFAQNWFAATQGVGIIAGLLFTAISLRRDAKSRRASDVLKLAQQHRALWAEVHRRRDLQRINKPEVDLVAGPVTPEEEEFLNVVFVHFYTTFLLSQSRTLALLPLKTLAVDIRAFFSLPLPQFVWRASKSGRDPKFVKFVEACLADGEIVAAPSKD
jgi:hypothetical protein